MSPVLSSASLPDRFTGSLLGLAVGDAIGACFEGQDSEWIARRYPSPESLIASPPRETHYYTDDTQMALGVAEALVEDGEIVEETLCRVFVSNYVPARGYGWGARRVLDAMEENEDYRHVAATHLPGGSFGNGGAMRVAPVGVYFHDDPDRVWEQADLSARPTHVHPLGIEGAQLFALAVAHLVRAKEFDRQACFNELISRCESPEFQGKLEQARAAEGAEIVLLGNGIAALDSVPTALACFASHPDEYGQAVARAILLGGDTDTIAAMTGALSGAFLGWQAIPAHWLASLEDEGKGRSYLLALAERLYERRGGKGG
jgi:poly(ADP-ribose) glycohydrolase ARH3